MKSLKIIILSALATALGLISSSCGDGPSSSTTDAAPSTMDGLSLNVSIGTNIEFGRISGDADGGIEIGFANAIDTDNSNFLLTNSVGNITLYELPGRLTNISYTYVKAGPNSGVLTVSGDSNGNGYLHTLDDDTGEIDQIINDADIYADSSGSFSVTYNIVFGSAAGFIGEIAVSANNVNTEETDPNNLSDTDGIDSSVDYFATTADQGVTISLQDGGDVPIGYDVNDALTVVRTTPDTLYPVDLSAAGPLTMTFLSGNSASYDTIGVTSDDQGFPTALDQGIYDLSITSTAGVNSTEESVTYAWFGQDQTGSNNIGELTLVRGSATEVYLFTFTSFEDGSFVRTSPDDGVTGTFSFPFAEDL